MRNATWLKLAKNAILILTLCALSASVALAGPAKIPEQSEEYKKGRALQKEAWGKEGKRKSAEARAIYEAGAKKGDPWCMSELGEYYLVGKGGLQKDETRGMELINRAIELYCPGAFFVLGVWYCNGLHGFPEDAQKGIELITKAGEMNYSYAFHWLGLFSLDGGMGIPQDPQKGVEILKRAAEMNDPDANNLIGNLYKSGTYVEQDYRIALVYFKKAKQLGYEHFLDDTINKLEQRLAE